jgi:Histidine kinase-, DNA gyrase B-, and HSP90-like ATPase
VKQVLLNLLSNALKFTPEGGRVEVRARVVDGMAEISVTDTGVGIAAEDQEAVFEEFRQVGTAEKKVEGTGLGDPAASGRVSADPTQAPGGVSAAADRATRPRRRPRQNVSAPTWRSRSVTARSLRAYIETCLRAAFSTSTLCPSGPRESLRNATGHDVR